MGGWEQVEEAVLAMVIAIVAWVRDVGGWVGGSKWRWAEACLHPHHFLHAWSARCDSLTATIQCNSMNNT